VTSGALLAVTLALAGVRGPEDSLRSQPVEVMTVETSVPGYLSPRGLPPTPGQVLVTDTGLVFRSTDGHTVETFPIVGPVRTTAGRRWRASAVSLAYVDQDGADRIYVFRLAGGVFVTNGPGSLLEVAERREWLDSLSSREWQAERGLVAENDSAGIRNITRRITTGRYADTLYALFGRPARPFGEVDARGRAARRLGEYLATRDSLALDPARTTSEAQLRHALAHELGHRWQSRNPAQLKVLWEGVPRIRDPKRYGHASVSEHQAEAIAFAVHFLQATSGAHPIDPEALLQQYERMVPGTRLVARYLALQPVYAAHPLRRLLTIGTQARALPQS
jgi:hypothetical protein